MKLCNQNKKWIFDLFLLQQIDQQWNYHSVMLETHFSYQAWKPLIVSTNSIQSIYPFYKLHYILLLLILSIQNKEKCCTFGDAQGLWGFLHQLINCNGIASQTPDTI